MPRAGRANPHMAIARVERQHRLIEGLRRRAPRFVTGEQLGLDLGVSVRTIERDIAELLDAGIPIDVVRGPGGGYAIDARTKLPPLTLTPGEAAAIIAALVAIGPYTSATGRSALTKVIEALTVSSEKWSVDGQVGRIPLSDGGPSHRTSASRRAGRVPPRR